MDKDVLIANIDKVHTTKMGVERIKKNLKINNNDNRCNIYRKGKNFYCEIDNIIITINSYSYTIITAHIK